VVLGAPDVGATHDQADRGVAVPQAHLGAAVDREQVALDEHPRAGDAVHDLLVDRGAQRVPVAGHELEVRDAAVVADVGLGERVELKGGHAGAHGGVEQLERAPHEQPGGAHAGELLGRLALAAVTVEQTHAAEPYRRPPQTPTSPHRPGRE
jgi:hypothetical protein